LARLEPAPTGKPNESHRENRSEPILPTLRPVSSNYDGLLRFPFSNFKRF